MGNQKYKVFQQLFDNLKRDVEFSDDELFFIGDQLSIVRFKKGDYILNPGDILKYWYYLNKGCVRMVYIVDGIEMSAAFYKEDEFFTVYHSFQNQKPSECALQCIEDCELFQCTRESDRLIFANTRNADVYARKRLRRMMEKNEEIISSLITKNAEERYKSFSNRHLELLNRIPLKDLASYLNMRPETLSRVRKKLAKGK